LTPHFYATATPPKSDMERIACAESFAANTGATVRHGGDRAYYSITNDYVQMPPSNASATLKAITRRCCTS
jgi:antirestriction protein ArdC